MKKIFKTTNAEKFFPKDPKRKKKIYTFFSFVLLSILFWLIINLSRENEANFNLEINVSNTPADLVIDKMSHEKITVNLQAVSTRLFYMQLVRRPGYVDLDFARFHPIEINGNFYYFITGRQIIPNLPSFMYEKPEIISVKPDTLFLKIKEAEKNRNGD